MAEGVCTCSYYPCPEDMFHATQNKTRLPASHMYTPISNMNEINEINEIARKRRPPRTTYSRKLTTTSSNTPKRRRLFQENNDSVLIPPLRSSSVPTASEVDDVVKSSDTPVSSPPVPAKKKLHFNFFTRASVISSRRRPTASAASPANTQNRSKKPKQLTQMTIDLGQTLQVTCRACGMSYHPSTPDDLLLHKRFHAKSVGGVDFALKLKDKDKSVVWKADEGDAHVLIVDRKGMPAEKRKAKEVLEVADSELGAAEIEEHVLWGSAGHEDNEGGRFKVYLYVQGKKCIGLCLAERIKRAYRVLDNAQSSPECQGIGSSVSVSNTSQPALLGISRIWTCSSHRRQGIAAKLLDCARETFIYGMELEKNMVAFSQPTESGGGLARRWFAADRREEGEANERWSVYTEEI